MKLFYYAKSRTKTCALGNFGDELNSWLWSRLIPGFLDEDDSALFVGIGTLLNDNLPKAPRTIVFGSGAGYGKGLPKIDNTWKVYCLRGPLSAKALGVSSDLAVTDAAILVRRLYKADVHKKKYHYSFMPHHRNIGPSWEFICQELGFGYIHPCWSTEKILTEISQTEVLISEAMHGAIVADALRIPWIAVSANPKILEFKWHDWSSSIGVNYAPKSLSPYWSLHKDATLMRRIRNWPRRQYAKIQLLRIAKASHPVLSKDQDIERLTVELENRLEQFKQDVAAGCYS